MKPTVAEKENLARVAAGLIAGDSELAWEQLLKLHEPMLHSFLPSWVQDDDRQDWLSEYKVTFVQALKTWDPGEGTQFSTFLFACLHCARRGLLEARNAKKRNPNKVACSLNDIVQGKDSEMGELLNFLVDTKFTSPEDLAMFTEFVCDVDSVLEPEQVTVWRWLLRFGGNATKVAEQLGIAVDKVKQVVYTLRKEVARERVAEVLTALGERTGSQVALDVHF